MDGFFKVASSQIDSGRRCAAVVELRDWYVQAKFVIERLLDPKPSYFAHKEILYGGLCAWTIRGGYAPIVQEAMVIVGALQLSKVERRLKDRIPTEQMFAEIVSRLDGPGIDFYNDFYYPMGGSEGVIKARSPALMRKTFRSLSRDIGFAVELMRVCHYHAERLQDRQRYRTASFLSAGKAVSSILKFQEKSSIIGINPADVFPMKAVDGLNCKKKSDKFAQTAAMIYAAYSIEYGDSNLLAYICKYEINFDEHKRLLNEWTGRAAFVAKNIILNMYLRDSIHGQTDYLLDIDPIRFNAPDYGELSPLIDQEFSKTRKSSGDQ